MADPYSYAAIRVVPRIDRDECFNVGVVLLARTRDFLGCQLDEPEAIAARLRALAPGAAAAPVAAQLAAIAAVCRGDRDAGPVGRLPAPERFLWIAAPRSTIVGCGPVHAGTCTDPAAALAHLFTALVAR